MPSSSLPVIVEETKRGGDASSKGTGQNDKKGTRNLLSNATVSFNHTAAE
jgi:hypothetical protein